MAKSISYSIHTTQPNPYDELQLPNIDTRLTQSLTGSDGTIDTAWTVLTATDGTGGFIGSDLVHAAELIVNGVVTDDYEIGETYDLAASVSSVITDSEVDPVSGEVTIAGDGSGTVTSFSAGTTGLTVATASTTPTLSGGQLVVANGGTGAATLTAHGVLLGEGTSAVAATAAGSAGQPLLSGGAGADPAFAASLGAGFGGTGNVTYTAGDILVATGATTLTKLAKGTDGQVLTMVAGAVAWATP